MTERGRYSYTDRFMRPMTLTTTPQGGAIGWTVKDTSPSGTPTYTTTSSGLVLTIAATSEAEIVTAYQNDILPYLLNKIRKISFTASVSGVNSVTTIVMGLASAQNDTADSVATLAWFRIEGSADTGLVVCETDDGVIDNDDKATAISLSSTPKRFVIDFSQGLSDIRFYIDDQPVSVSNTFSMANASASQCVQLFFQIQKASGTGVPALTIREVEIDGIFAD